MSESICSIGSWSRRLGPSDFTGYGASAIRTDGSPSRGLRPACGGLFPCRGDKRLGRDHPRNSAPAEPDTVDLLAREQSHHARASPPRDRPRGLVSIPLAFLSIGINRYRMAMIPFVMMLTYRVLQLVAGVIHIDRFAANSTLTLNYFGGGLLMLVVFAYPLIAGSRVRLP